MTPDFMRPKTNGNAENDSDVKMKRSSAHERSETVADFSQLRRNNSYIDSRTLQDASSRRSSSGWSDMVHDIAERKPPMTSPRGSFKRSNDSENKLCNGSSDSVPESVKKSASLSVSSSVNSMRKIDEDSDADSRESTPTSNSLNTTNIKRVQEKSNKFLESLSSKQSAPQRRHLVNSASTSSIPRKTAEAVAAVIETKQNHSQFVEDLKKALNREAHKKSFLKVKIVEDDGRKSSNFKQINEVYTAKSSWIDINQIHKIRTKEDKEYHVRVKINEKVADEVIEVHPVLAKVLGIEQSGEKVEVIATKLVCNLVDNIDLVPLTNIIEGGLGQQIAKDIEEKFKKYVNAHTRILPLILNQNQVFKLDDYILTIKLHPLSTPVCCIDSEILRENIIDVVRLGEANELAGMLQEDKKKKKKDEESKVLKLESHQKIIDWTVEHIHPTSNKFKGMNSEQNNFIIAGASKSGKTVICNEIQKHLELRNINVSVFNCAQYKGRKVDSIIKDMKSMLMACLKTAPSAFIVFNLESLAAISHEDHQTQEGEYLQKLSNSIRHLLEDFTHDYGNLVSVLVTVSKLSNLNKVLYRSFGYYLFKNVVKIPNLESDDRRELFKRLLLHGAADVKIDKNLDWDKYVRLTEGYQIGDICQFADRVIFFAVKENYKSPMLTEELMNKSLAISNQHCLEGIRTEAVDGEEQVDLNEKIPGMDSVIEILEEVLIWPTKFPKIFQNSPLRNQAGILLFGAPGTGKGFIVSQITKRWNLRLISIKGPELLAKYIGQSEENVRNLFEKAKSAKPCVLFFDEFDSLAPRRGHDSTGVTDRVVNQLLTELDGVKSLEGVSIICATSRPDLIDPALLRSGRIDRLVECQLPSTNGRFEILKWLTKSITLDPSIDLKALAIKLDNFSGADIKSILTTANMNAIEEELKKNDGRGLLDEVLIRKGHLDNALNTTRPSLTRQDIEKYQILYDKFKSKKSITTETPKKVSLA